MQLTASPRAPQSRTGGARVWVAVVGLIFFWALVRELDVMHGECSAHEDPLSFSLNLLIRVRWESFSSTLRVRRNSVCRSLRTRKGARRRPANLLAARGHQGTGGFEKGKHAITDLQVLTTTQSLVLFKSQKMLSHLTLWLRAASGSRMHEEHMSDESLRPGTRWRSWIPR